MSKASLLEELAKRSAAASTASAGAAAGPDGGHPDPGAAASNPSGVAEDSIWHEAGGLDVAQLRIGTTAL